MPSGLNLHLKVSGLAGILMERGTISEETFDAICYYDAATGNYEKVKLTYELKRFGKAIRGLTKLIKQPGYFEKIEAIVQTQILPLAKKVSWYDLFKAERKSTKILAKRKEREAREETLT